MAYPYFNGPPVMNVDPNDSRYHYSNNTSNYPTTLEVDVNDEYELDPEYQDDYNNSQRYPQRESYYGFSDHFLSPGSSINSSHPDNIWSPNESRGMSSRTAPEVDYAPVPSGPRCIFHWEGCKFRADKHDDWVEHIYYVHFEPEDHANPHKLYFGRTPTSWTCRFRNCREVMGNDDHRALWDAKLAHLFRHFSVDQGWPEEVEEDISWLRYYQQMGFCTDSDVCGGVSAPPPKQPYKESVMVWRKTPRRKGMAERGYLERDALGESVLPFSQQMLPAQYPVQYVAQYTPPVQQYEYRPPMGPEQFPPPPPPPGSYPYGFPGTAQY